LRLVIGQPGVREGDRAIRLAIDMRQDNAVGVENAISTGDWFLQTRAWESDAIAFGSLSDARKLGNVTLIARS
jgi:hypothetical protein